MQDGSIVEKKMYQQSNCFTFSIGENGLYYFALFVKESDNKQCDPVIKYTEKFEIKNYKLALLADEEVQSVCTLINEITWCRYKDIDAKINEDVILADIIYLINIFSKDKNDDEVVNSVYLALKRCKEQNKKIILLIRYISEYSRSNIVQEVIKETLKLQVDFVDCHQILHYGADGAIIYEEYHRYCKALKDDLLKLLDMYDSDALWGRENYVDISITNNILHINIVSEKQNENIKYNYYILKDGCVYYKHGNWESEHEFSYLLSENGIYMVQAYIKFNEKNKILKSHTVEYFSDDYRREFSEFCNFPSAKKNISKLPLFTVPAPWVDFAVIQSKEKIKSLDMDRFSLYELMPYGDKNNYLMSTALPIERYGKKWLCSGVISSDKTLRYGYDMLDEITSLKDVKMTGIYTIAEIDSEKIRVANDFFNFNRVFYYVGNEKILCSNNYHLLLLLLNKLGEKLRLDESKALMTLSSVKLPYFTQNMCNKMDMKNVVKCPNSYDIVLNQSGMHLEINEYGQILHEKKIVNEVEYRKALEQGRREIIGNIETIVHTEKDKKIVVDLSGGLDSRLVYGGILQTDIDRERLFVYSKDVAGSKDLDIAVAINSTYGLQWDSVEEEYVKRGMVYADMVQRSFYMGIYYSHNLITSSLVNKSFIRLIGACGEILLRPYTSRKFLNIKELDTERYLDYLLRNWGEGLVVDYSANKEFIRYIIEEFENYEGCSLQEKMDRVYLEHRHGYHFDMAFMIQKDLAPLQSKTLFKVHHSTYDTNSSIKQQLDMLNIMEPYLSAFLFDAKEDNEDKDSLKNVLLYEKEYYRHIKCDNILVSRNEYELSTKQKRVSYIKMENDDSTIDFYSELLDAWRYLCNYSKLIREKVGVAIYYYIQTHSKEEDKKQLRYLYNKIMSLRDQLMIFDEGCEGV